MKSISRDVAPTGSRKRMASVIVDGTEPEVSRLEIARGRCTANQAAFAEEYIRCRNKAMAYRKVYVTQRPYHHNDYSAAIGIGAEPNVRAYIREIESEAAKSFVIDVASLLAHDAEIVEGHKQIQDMQQRAWRNCRHCYGVKFKRQWINEDEFTDALCAAMDAAAKMKNPEEAPMPTDEGGYGFDAHKSPNNDCPQCFGDGVQITSIFDTRMLQGAAAVAFKGIKETKHGIEILTHDVDKAKERLLRAAGAFGDDAASVARGAAAGAAVGAAAAQALQARAATMTPEEKRKAYLSLVS